jgi:hypothetical protein
VNKCITGEHHGIPTGKMFSYLLDLFNVSIPQVL